MAQFQLAAQQLRDFQVISRLDADLLTAASEQLSRLAPPPLTPVGLISSAKEAFGGNDSAAECIVRQCLWLNGLMRQTGLDANAVIEGVRHGIERDSEWPESEIQKWHAIESRFQEILCVDAFRIVAKAIDLSYEYANLYRSGRILADIRPLFSGNANSIEAAVVSCTLRLRYDSVEGDHALSIAMDEADVRELAQQCERALKKARTAHDFMEGKAEIPTIVTGERDDA